MEKGDQQVSEHDADMTKAGRRLGGRRETDPSAAPNSTQQAPL